MAAKKKSAAKKKAPAKKPVPKQTDFRSSAGPSVQPSPIRRAMMPPSMPPSAANC